MPTSSDGSDYTYLPQILKADGDYFSAMVYVRAYLPPYDRHPREAVVLANNNEIRAWMGDPQKYHDSFTVEVWGAGAYVEVMEAAADPETNGLLTLRVPEPDGTGGDEYLITLDMPPMDRAWSRRDGYIQMFTVAVENVKVHGSASL